MKIIICLASTIVLTQTLFAVASDKTILIESNPSGAQVEANDNLICKTPCNLTVSKAYFGAKHTVFSGHVDQPLRIRISMTGYVPKDVTLTQGPLRWQSLNGQNSFEYFLLSADHFSYALEPIQSFLGESENVDGAPTEGKRVVAPLATAVLSSEQIIHNSLPAIVQVRTPGGSGSGFFITSHGIVATNAHVVRAQPKVTVLTSDGTVLESESIYVDEDRDVAFIKVNTSKSTFLELSSAFPSQGAEVLAIGTPGTNFDASATMLFPNTVTRGIVSGIRNLSDTPLATIPGTAGTWIQTDAAINHGNSGGPLLDKFGKVVGINTLSLAPAKMSGVFFALSSRDLIQVAQYRFGLSIGSAPAPNAPQNPAATSSNSMLSITSTPPGADIEVDGVFLGDTPAEIPVSTGIHTVKLSKKGCISYERKIQVLSSGTQRVSIELELSN